MRHKSAAFIVILSLISVQEFGLLGGSERSFLVKSFTDNTQEHRPAADNQTQLSPANTLNGDNSNGFSDISPLAGPPPEGRGGDGGRRPPGPGRRGPERSERGDDDNGPEGRSGDGGRRPPGPGRRGPERGGRGDDGNGPEGRGGDGGRRPPGPGRKGPERGGRGDDVSALAGPPPEGRGGDGGRRPPEPGRRGPERGGRGERRDPPEDGPEGGDRMSEGQPRTQRAPVDEKGPADHEPRHRKASLYGTAEEGSQLRRESHQPGTMLGLLLRDQNVVSGQRRDSASGDKQKRLQRGKKDKQKEDSNESDGDNHDGDYDDGDYDAGKSRQKQRRGRMSQRQGSGAAIGQPGKNAGCYWFRINPRRRGGGGNGNGGGDAGGDDGGDDYGGGDDGGGDDAGGDDGGDDYADEAGRLRRRRRKKSRKTQKLRMRRRRRKNMMGEGANTEDAK